MRTTVTGGLAGLAACMLMGVTAMRRARASDPPAVNSPGTPRGVAVVELFTSEGCSSCPPADLELARLDTASRAAGLPVYTLSFHVDYWNDLGWPDPLSAGAYTRRQQAYAHGWGTSRIYTPQMVVNGVDAFVGSQCARADTAVAHALATEATAHVHLEGTRSGHRVRVTFAVTGHGATVLNIAVVRPEVASVVTAGENRGQRLVHRNVVVGWTTVALGNGAAGTQDLVVPPEGPLSVIAVAQQGETGPVVGATALALPAP